MEKTIEDAVGLNVDQRIELRLALEEFIRDEERLERAKKDLVESKQRVIAALEPADSILAIKIHLQGFIVQKSDDGFALRPCEVLL